jgi:phage gpG-like protein
MLKIEVEGLDLFNMSFWGDSIPELEKELLEELKRLWKLEKDPDGNPWLKRKEPTGSWAILDKTGKLQLTARVLINRSIVARVEPYGEYHQWGTRSIPQRKMFGLPDKFLEKASNILWKNLTK